MDQIVIKERKTAGRAKRLVLYPPYFNRSTVRLSVEEPSGVVRAAVEMWPDQLIQLAHDILREYS